MFQTLINRKGMALVVAMLILLALTIIGIIAMNTTIVDTVISGNVKYVKQAYYLADAGISHAADYLAQNPSNWAGYAAYQTLINTTAFSSGSYTVTVQDGGNNRRKVISTGTTASGAAAQIEAFFSQAPPIIPPAALYVKSNTIISGSNTNIIGIDGCGTDSKHGLCTTLSPGSVTENGSPQITGVGGAEDIQYNAANLDIQSYIDSRKPNANYAYAFGSNTTNNGMNWGIPAPGANQQSPSSCGVSNTVYYNMNGNTITLSGGTSGCGTLLIDGNLTTGGGFSWYGIIIVTGSITFSGGGSKNVTGAVISEGSSAIDSVTGNANIVYCSTAVSNQNQNLPVLVLSRRDLY